MAGVILEARLQVKIAQRDPAGFAAPAHMDDFLPIGQQCSERGDGARRGCVGEREELILAGGDTNGAHRSSLADLVSTVLMSNDAISTVHESRNGGVHPGAAESRTPRSYRGDART